MAVKVSDPLFVLYDGDCGLCSRTAQALRILDRRGRLRLMPLQHAAIELGDSAPPLAAMRESLHAGVPGRGWSTGGEASLRIARAIPILRSLAIVGSLPLVNRLVEPGYVLLATNRDRIGRIVGAERCKFGGDPLEPGQPHPEAVRTA
jgi:predicted DCC family thiol-disulfide oxidoreductase YuxK